MFSELDKPIQGREFPLSKLTVLLMLKVMLGVSYRTMASLTKDLQLYSLVGLKRAPCYKTLQNTMEYHDKDILDRVNRQYIPNSVELAGIDASGLRTTRKGGWVVIRFGHKQRKRDYKKLHILVDLNSKKILYCTLTRGTAADSPQLPIHLEQTDWIKFEMVLADGGYDVRSCFNSISERNAVPGIPVRKNASPRAHGCPSRRHAVLEQQKDKEKWKESVKYTMRAIVEGIFSATKRRYGETLACIRDDFRVIEVWLRTLLWNVTIYPR
jgi:transposase